MIHLQEVLGAVRLAETESSVVAAGGGGRGGYF